MRVIIALMLLFVAGSGRCQERETPRELYESVCAQCHGLNGYVWERSYKSWQSTVYAMQSYAAPNSFSNEEADIIIDYLTERGGQLAEEFEAEEEARTEAMHVEPEPGPNERAVDSIEAVVSAPIAIASVTPEKKVPTYRWRAIWARAGIICGYIGFAFLIGAVVSGLLRGRLNQRFRLVHRVAAGMVFLTALLHSIYFLATLGLPHLLWIQFGVGSTGFLLVTGLSGRFRRKLRRGFIKTHVTVAAVALVAAVLHWVWIYM